MKKKLLISILITIVSANIALAEYSFVDTSDFTGDAFFTPPQLQEQNNSEETKMTGSGIKHSVPPLKKLRIKIKNKLNARDAQKNELAPTAPVDDIYDATAETSEYASKDIKDDFDDIAMPDGFEADEEAITESSEKKHFWQRKPKEKVVEEPTENIILDCENVDYDTDSYCVTATGNVNVRFVKQGTDIKADKITYDRMNNTIKAEGNVRIIKGSNVVNGEYIFVDMNEENALVEKPITTTATLEIKSEKGYVYGDKIVQENGSLSVDKHFPINFRSKGNGPNLSRMISPKYEDSDDPESGVFKLKTKDLIISEKGDLEIITLNKFSVFKGKRKIYKMPSVKLYTNKTFDFAESNAWEIGSIRGMGLYTGPGYVFEVPGGSVLKVMPILNYYRGIGVGGVARYSSASNWTQVAYGTADDKMLIRGQQKLDDNLELQYVMNDYMREWFLGRRRAKYGIGLVHQTGHSKQDFLLKGQVSSFAHRFDTGYYQDIDYDSHYRKNGGTQIGTMRTRYMAQVSQGLFHREDKENQKAFGIYAVGQLAAGLYGTGDTQVIGRIGPTIHTQYKRWMQDIGYFQSAYHDETPMPVFDAYRYGKSNFFLREYFRINRYLTVSWFGSYNLSNDAPNDKALQENSFYFTFGPDDIKFSLGYDFIRENLRFMVEVMMDAQGTRVDYERMEIKQDKKAQKKEEVKDETQNNYQKPQEAPVLQRAIVEDVKSFENVL